MPTHHCLFGGRAALDSKPHRGATWLKKNSSKSFSSLNTSYVSFSVTWPVFHVGKGYPEKAGRVLLLCVAQTAASLCLHGLMPITIAFKYKLKTLWLTKNQMEVRESNSGLPGNPFNSLIHGSFRTRHSQSQSSLGVHSSAWPSLLGHVQGEHRASDNNLSQSALTTGPLQHLSLSRMPFKARAWTFHPGSTAQTLSVPGARGYKQGLLLLARGNSSVNGRH